MRLRELRALSFGTGRGYVLEMDLETLIASLESNSATEQRTSLILTDEDAARLALALENNNSLVELDLTTNKLSANGAGT